jgi:Fibronectin type III domain
MGTGRLNMKRSTCSAVAKQRRGKSSIAARVCICLTVLLVLGAVSASAQSTAVPPTSTAQILGVSPTTPAPSLPPTAPVGGIILYGSQISNITNQPVRHFWIGDSNFGLCRVDPDIDTAMAALAAAPLAPSPFSVTINTCPFKLNGISVTGGPMAFDPINNKLYLTDEQTNAEAILRLGYDPTADSGQGAIDLTSVFSMTGNITGSRFGGGTTGCPFPSDSTTGGPASPLGRPNAATLSPDGNLYVGFKKSGGIIRINNPATADTVGFGTCNDFVQLVAATPTRGGGNGMAFVGPDLWSADAGGPFVIRNAATTCQALSQVAPQTPTCPGVRSANATFAALAPTSLYSDQTYPYQNGNNLYFGNATDDMWVGNISGGGTVVRNPFEPAGAFTFNANPVVNVNGVMADATDAANVVMYSGDDPSGAALLGQGRWWFVAQNPPAKAGKPAQVTVVRAAASGTNVTVTWSPAQTGETVTFYTVHASTVPAGVVLADQTVLPPLGGKFPPNFLVIPGLPNGAYSFRVIANNGFGNNGLNSIPSLPVTLPAIPLPLIPTNVVATAGDTVAFVNFAAPPNAAAYAITGYQITSTPGGLVSPVLAAAATSGTVTGLTDGTSYTFTVHAINAGGISMESTPSNAVTPAAKPQVTIKLTGPIAETTVPVQATYTATLTNNTATDVTATTFTFVLTQVVPDGANIVTALTGQGTCGAGGAGVTTVTCSIGTLVAGTTVNVNILINIVANSVTGTATFTATDVAANLVTGTSSFNIATPTAPPQGGNGPTVAVLVSGTSAKPQMNKLTSTTHTFSASNTTSTVVDNVTFTISEPAQFTIGTITAISSQPALGTVTCGAPAPGVLNGIAVNNINCTIPHLGGNLKGGTPLTAPQSITITVSITAPNTASTSTVQGVVSFNGVDAVTPIASFTQIVK